ncbi:class I SAM-dependent methyltransferase [Acidocella sp.]|uniref:class I SAM-dependent methyltransferase n=1 Tax=Acidocella sp. TaxID=50710 RepID=UPI0026062B51|nr:class I SAM-dependent methyltransferase [Acidocella sp.]
MASAAALRLTSHCELEWLHGEQAEAACPNCGGTGAVTQLAEISYDLFGAAGRYRLQLCPRCDVRFASALATMDYGGDELLQIGWPAYYAQIGAGIWPITDPLSRIAKPPGARALEIGGAYGFGLDFCVHARGWRGVGYDPSPLAGLGARALGLDLRQGYFTAEALGDGPWDVILATEVVEHLEDPPAFLRLMRQAIADDGMLVLTTPNAAWITPALSPGELYALLAPGAHVVLQSARSLELALKAAGFSQVTVRTEAATLTAYASPAPFRLEEEFGARRGLYRRYLGQRAAAAAPGSDPQLGFAGRLIFDAVNDGDAEGAAAAWDILNEACQARFGYRLEGLAGLPVSGDEDLEGLAAKMPLGLGTILYAQAMRRLAAGEARSALKPGLELARAAIAALQAALDRLSLGRDRLSVSIDEVIGAELLLCDAEAGESDVVEPLLARGDRRGAWRGFVALVNAGAYEAAARLRDGLGDPAKEELPAGLRRDALLSLANFHLAAGEASQALAAADGLETLGEPGDAIRLEVFLRLVNAGRYQEALALDGTHDVMGWAAKTGSEAARDAALARAVLDLAVGDPALVPARLAAAQIEEERGQPLLLAAFTGLVNAGRYDEALALDGTHDIMGWAAKSGSEAARDAALARAVLDLAVGDPALVPARLAAAQIEEERGQPLLLAAFTGLVNAGRYDEADALAAAHPWFAELDRLPGEAARDARRVAVSLDLQQGRTEAALQRAEALERRGGEDRNWLDRTFVEIFIRLAGEGKFAAARALDVEERLASCPDALRQDALAALVMVDAQPGGKADNVARRLGALAGSGVPQERLDHLTLSALSVLTNRAEMAAAREVLPLAEPLLLAARPPFAAALRDALFAAGILYLQDEPYWARATATFSRLRDALVKECPPGEGEKTSPAPLFWHVLRGEVVALQRLGRDEEAIALLRAFLPAYQDAPEDLRGQWRAEPCAED